MATFTRVQHNSTNPSTAAASLTATLASGVTAGNLLIATICVGTDAVTVTPPAGWQQAGPTETGSGDLHTQIFYLVVGTGGATSFVFSWSGSHSFGWTIDEWNSDTGWQPSPVDSSQGAPGATTAVSCGSPAATTQASELWFGVLSWADSGQTLSGVTSGWTTGDTSAFSGNNTNVSFFQTRTTTGTPSLAATISAARDNGGVVATFKPNVPAGFAPSRLPQPGSRNFRRRHHRIQQMVPPPPPVFVDLTDGGSGSDSLTSSVAVGMVVSVGPLDPVSSSAGVAHSVTPFSPVAGDQVRVCASWLDATDLLGKTFTLKDSNNVSYGSPTQFGGDADGGCYLIVWDHVYTSDPGPITLTVTCSNTAQADCLIQVYEISNQDPDQSTAAQNQFSEVGTPTNTYLIATTPTRLNSVMFVLAAPNNNNHPVPIPNANTQTDAEWDDDGVGSHAVFGRSLTPTSSLTSTTYGWTSTAQSIFGYGVMVSEVLPLAATSKTLTDSGSAADILGVLPGFAEPGTGSEALAVSQPTALTEAGSGSQALGVTPGLTDTGSGADALGVTLVSSVALSGSGTLTAAGLAVQPAAAALSGSGTLAAAGLVTQPAAASLTGTGTLAAAPAVKFASASALSGTGTLGAQGLALVPCAAALSGSGSLTAAAAAAFASAAALSGSGTVTAAVLAVQPAAATLSGSGTLAAVAGVRFAEAVALSGLGSLASAAVVTQPGAASLAGSGSLAASPSVQFTSAAALSGTGTLAAAGTVSGLATGSAALAGSGSLTVSAAVTFTGAAALSGSGTIAAAALVTQPASAALSGAGSLAASAVTRLEAAAVLSGSGTLTSAALAVQPAAASLTGSGSLAAVAAVQFASALVLSGTGALTAAGTVSGLATASAALSGSGSLAAAALVRFSAGVPLSGSGTVAAAALVAVPGAAALSGSGSIGIAVTVTVPAAAALSGQGTITATAAVAAPSGVTLSGTGTLSAGAVVALAAAASLAGTGTITAFAQVISPVTEPPVLWSVQPAALRWRAQPCPPRWTASPSQLRWRLVMALFPPIAAISLEEVNVTWESSLNGTSVDPTGQTAGEPALPVQFAFPQSSGDYAAPAQPATWFTGSWLLGGTSIGYVAQCLVGPGGVVTLTAGLRYDVWSRVTAKPESPAKFAGALAVY